MAAKALLLLLLPLLLSTATAQSTAPPPPYGVVTFSTSTATIAVIVLASIVLIGFFSIYLRLCTDASANNPLLLSVHRRPLRTGLDTAVIESFPVIVYSEIKEHKIGKGALECAICLNEFEEEETLRLIPKCDHVFHPECIDAWLELHVTCPVCRANLLPDQGKKTDTDLPQVATLESPVAVTIVQPAQEESQGRRARFLGRLPRPADQDESMGGRPRFIGKFPRSHSTGHSIMVVAPGECTERFTLRLPDHIRKEVLSRAAAEGSTRRGRRVGEGSSRGGRMYKRLDRAVKSDRWVINMPFLTQGKAGDGEGSTGRGVRSAVRLSTLKQCLGPSTSDDQTTYPIRAAV